MKKVSLILIITFLFTAVFYSIPSSFAADEQYPGFRVKGRFLYDKNGEKTTVSYTHLTLPTIYSV